MRGGSGTEGKTGECYESGVGLVKRSTKSQSCHVYSLALTQLTQITYTHRIFRNKI